MIITVGSNTRTVNDGNGTTWAEDDDLTVIHSATSASTPAFWPSQFFYNGGNAFHGTVSRLSATNNWYAVYPYAESNASAAEIAFTLPSSQTQTGNASKTHLAGRNFPLFGKAEGVARSTELSLPMKNLLAVAKFNVTNNSSAAITIKEIEYTASSPIAGTFSVDLTGENPVFSRGSSTTAKLTVNGGTTIAAGATTEFYMAIAPYEAAAGTVRQVKVVATDGTPCYRTFNSEVTFKSGVIKNIDFSYDKNHQTPEIDDPGTAGEVDLEIGEEPEDGVYLLVYDNGENSMAFAAFDDYKGAKYAIPVSVVDGLVYPKGDLGSRDLSDFAVELENTRTEHPNDAGHFAYNVRNSEGKYVFYATAGGAYSAEDALHIMDINEMDVQGTVYKYYHTFVGDADGVKIRCSIATGGNSYLLTYSESRGFYYSNPEEEAQGEELHLYQVGETTPKVEQTLEFDETAVTYNFDNGGDFIEPQLTGDYHTTVTYSSNNTSVATVDENGNVTIHAAGTATITATAPAGTVDGVEYKSASASYTITSTSTKNRVFYLTTELEANQEYLIVSSGKALTNNNGSIAATTVSPVNGEISIAESSSMVWVSAQSGSGFSFANAGKYISTSSSTSYNPSPSLGNTATAWNYDDSSNYLFYSQNSGYGSFDYYLYYSSSSWTLGNSYFGTPGTVALYSATRPATKQTLSFAKSTDRWYVGEGGDHEFGRTYDILQLDGAFTDVTYTSSNTQIAEIINNSQIKVKALGSTKITATAAAGTVNGIEYREGSASYTLYIKEPVSGEWTELEGSPFNLENADVKAYLDAATTSNAYTGSNISSSIISDYAPGGRYSTITTQVTDYGQPVTIDWGTPSSGTATITILADDQTTEVWTQTASSGSTSINVYNLIPGETYYCTVEDNTGSLLQGVFETTGRRRMMKISEGTSEYYARNCRDLGGLETIDGGRIRYGMIFRGTNLDSTSDSEQSYMANDLNIGWDIDLRQSSEGKNAFASKYGVTWVMCDFNAYVNSSHLTNATKVQKTMEGFINAAKAGKASYFHCRIGSDRTGYWGLIIEGLLGVNLQDCSMDYELTSFANNIGSLGNRIRTSGLFKDGVTFLQGLSYYDENDPNWLQNTIKQYLINDVKIPEADINYFINALVEYDY